MNRFRRFSGLFPIAVLILAATLFQGCDTTDTGPRSPEGEWESNFTRINEENGFPDNIRFTLVLDAKRKSTFATYWNGLFAKGFAGGWSYQGDSLFLTATECYKGDSSGIQFINNCDEDLPTRVMKMNWDGEAITYGGDADRILFHRKDI